MQQFLLGHFFSQSCFTLLDTFGSPVHAPSADRRAVYDLFLAHLYAYIYIRSSLHGGHANSKLEEQRGEQAQSLCYLPPTREDCDSTVPVQLSALPVGPFFHSRRSLPCNGRNLSPTINSRTKQSNRDLCFTSLLRIFEFLWSCRSKHSNSQQDRVPSKVDTKRFSLLRTAGRRGDGRGPFTDAPAQTGSGHRAR